MPFAALGLHPTLVKQVQIQSYTSPTPIQSEAIPAIITGRDIIGLAQTGTGKTAAFVLPVLHQLMKEKRSGVRTIILVPTRELAEQVNDVIRTFSRGTGIRSTPVYGGVSFERQVQVLRQGVEIIVACPGRLLDHIQQNTVNLKSVEICILDEADHLFDMGFIPTVRKILRALPQKRQNLMFSATMPSDIRRLAEEVLRNPQVLQVANTQPVETVQQALFPVPTHLKTKLLKTLLKDIPREESVLIFTRTKHRAKKLHSVLADAGMAATSLQGNLSQNRRASSMKGFRDGKFQIMVATDIAARGIDISQVAHVVNYDFPDTVEAYTHRIGRTGRAARTGSAYTFVTNEDGASVKMTERALKTTIERIKLAGFDYTEQASASDPTQNDRRFNQGNTRNTNRGRQNQRGHNNRAPNQQQNHTRVARPAPV